jgi:hypothetical protein
MWMLRVIDAEAAIAARGFPPGVSASVPLEIQDQARPANSGHWRLTVANGTGMLSPNEIVPSPAALTLGPRGVAALDAAFAATPYMVDDF